MGSDLDLSPADIAQLRAATLARGWPWWSAPFDLNLFGIRGASSQADLYDDGIGIAWTDAAGHPHGRLFRATTDPGRPWLQRPSRASGCAILVGPAWYRGMYALGLHKGRAALVQAGPCRVWRDDDRDAVLGPLANPEGFPVEAGGGINLHDPGAEDPGKVGYSSAGCQVPWRAAYVGEIREALQRQTEAGHGGTLSYALHHANRAPELAALLSRLES